MSNIFRQAALTQKKKGDHTTSSHVQIFRLPTKVLLTASVISALAGTVWAATAKIPIDFPGRAVVLDIDTWQDVVSGGNGRMGKNRGFNKKLYGGCHTQQSRKIFSTSSTFIFMSTAKNERRRIKRRT